MRILRPGASRRVVASDGAGGDGWGAEEGGASMENSVANERRRRQRREQPTREEARAVFHRLWTKEVGKGDYVKRDWRELRQMIFRLTGLEL